MLRRVVEPELLDSLPPDDPAAIHSRRDLQRLNGWMRNRQHVLAAILNLPAPPATIVELGSGDGTFLLWLARRLHPRLSAPVQVYLLDLEPVVTRETLDGFAQLGWRAEIVKANLLEWMRHPTPPRVDLTVANLFLHHFQDDDLSAIFTSLNRSTRALVACEPRRWRPSLVATRLIWAIGCNRVTRHDAYVSVRAGFRDRELSALWPAHSPARLTEYPSGYASHLFTAHHPP